MTQRDARLVTREDERVAHADRPRTLRSLAAHGDVTAEFDDDTAARCDVIGDEVDDERLGTRAEVELTRRVQSHGVGVEVEVDRGRSERRHGRAFGDVVGEFIEVPVVAEGHERGQDRRIHQVTRHLRGVQRRDERRLEHRRDRYRRAVTAVESREFGVMVETIARSVDGVQPLPKPLRGLIHLAIVFGGERPGEAPDLEVHGS